MPKHSADQPEMAPYPLEPFDQMYERIGYEGIAVTGEQRRHYTGHSVQGMILREKLREQWPHPIVMHTEYGSYHDNRIGMAWQAGMGGSPYENITSDQVKGLMFHHTADMPWWRRYLRSWRKWALKPITALEDNMAYRTAEREAILEQHRVERSDARR